MTTPTEADIEQKRCQLRDWESALNAAMTGSSYNIDGINVTRQDVERVIRPNINRLQRRILRMESALAGGKYSQMRVANLQDPSN